MPICQSTILKTHFLLYIIEGILLGLVFISELEVDDFKDCIFEIKSIDSNMSGIQSLDIIYISEIFNTINSFLPKVQLVEEDGDKNENENEDEDVGVDVDEESESEESMSEGEKQLAYQKLELMFGSFGSV